MTTGAKIQYLRKQNNITQEELADLLGVSRQSISKWESDSAWPETEKLIRMSEIFHVTVDYLLKDVPMKADPKPTSDLRKLFHYEYKSKRILFGKPLVHINVGIGLYQAKGIIAIGNIAKGYLSVGILSLGLLSIGAASLGVIGLGAFTVGLVSIGAIAAGIIAIGAIAIGLFSIGAISVGLFSYGAMSIANYVAIGDYAYGQIAIGKTYASGTVLEVFGDARKTLDVRTVKSLIEEHVPTFWYLFKEWIKALIR